MSGSTKRIKGQNPHGEAMLLHDHIVDCAQDLGAVSALMGAAMALCTLQIELTVEPSVEGAKRMIEAAFSAAMQLQAEQSQEGIRH
jgi:hypothetical protein